MRYLATKNDRRTVAPINCGPYNLTIVRQAGEYSCNTHTPAIHGGRTAPTEVRMHGI